MGGKHKQAQRVKNNARPSSSGRSAELLSSTASLPQFSGIKDIGFMSSLMKHEEIDPTIDSNFQIVFKKMNKKDSTTKLKALQEFADLIATSSAEPIKVVLGIWCRIYNDLATDSDHRVREAVQNAHHQIVLKDKKIIAPYLKQLIGAWFTSQYDTYPPAASAASKAFLASFSPSKTQACIVFCQKEILTYVSENLLTEAVNNPKITSPGDIEAKLERMVISSLQGYCMYLKTLTKEQIEENVELNQSIISNPKFLKLASHRISSIRASWFRVLTALYQKAPFLLSDHGRTTTIVIGKLDENDPMVIPYVWESVMILISTVQEWWKFISVEKLFLPKLWKVLQKSGNGNAAVIYPNFLALLTHLPPLDLNRFYEMFFENLRSGLNQTGAATSKSESAAVITALIECLQYVIMRNQSDTTLCEKLVKCHFLPIIELYLKKDHCYDKAILSKTASLVQNWNKFGNSVCLRCFWENVNVMFQNIFADAENNYNPEAIRSLAKKQINFVTALRTANCLKSQTRVRFSTEETEVEISQSKQNSTATILDESYLNDLESLVFVILQSYTNVIKKRHCVYLLEEYLAFVRLFESKDFLLGLAKCFSESEEHKDNDLIVIFQKLLLEHLLSPDSCIKAVVDIVFLLFKYLNLDGKECILELILKNVNGECLSWCIIHALTYPNNQDGLITKWLLNKRITDHFIDLVKESLNNDGSDPQLKRLLEMSFSTRSTDSLINQEAFVAIAQMLQTQLLSPKEFSSTIEATTSLASYLVTITYSDEFININAEDLVLALFDFSCNVTHLDAVSYGSIEVVNAAWEHAVQISAKNMSKEDFWCFLQKFSNVIHDKLFSHLSEVTNADHFITIIVNFIQAIFNSRPLMITEVFDKLFMCPSVVSWKSQVTRLCNISEYLMGKLCCPYENLISFDGKISEDDIVKYFIWSYMKVAVLTSPLQDIVDSDNEDEEEEVHIIAHALNDNCLRIAEDLYDITAADVLLEQYKMARCYVNIESSSNKLRDKIKLTIEKLQLQEMLKPVLMDKLKTESMLWSRTIYLFFSEISPAPLPDVYRECLKFLPLSNKLSILHLTQVFGKKLNFDHVINIPSAIESTVILRSLLHCDEIDVQIAEVFGRIEKLRENDIATFLYENKQLSWAKFSEIIEVIWFFAELIDKKFEALSRRHWDFGVLSLVAWTSNCVKAKAHYKNEQVQAFIIALSRLFSNLSRKMKELGSKEGPKNDFVGEWEDLFLYNIHSDMVQIWLNLTEQFAQKKEPIPLATHCLLQEISNLISNFDHKLIFTNDGTLPNWTKFIKRSCGLLTSPVPTLQLWGYKMLIVLESGLINIDLATVNADLPQGKELTLVTLKEVLMETDEIVDRLLTGFILGEDSCQVQPFTDSFTYVFAYLLIWCVILDLCEKSPPELRCHYAHWLRKDCGIKRLLNNVFKLMPAEVLNHNVGKPKCCIELFTTKPELEATQPYDSESLEHVVCWVYTLCLSHLPAVVRQWWSGTETKFAPIVDRVTAAYASSALCNQELSDIFHRENNFKNMSIKVMPSVKEVCAVYTVDDAQMELTITLPANYPLSAPNVQCDRQIGGTSHKQWLMQLKKCLLHQNGRVWDAISLWNSNLDKKFDGVEECYICFAVLHPSSYQLPKLSCQTCKKKFHSACLYKWFSTSNKSSCPICRNLF